MNLVLTRIDNRLIHGQVLETWVPFVNADCILVANNNIAANPMKKMMMLASVPSRTRVEIDDIDAIVNVLHSVELKNKRVLLLFATTADALYAYKRGLVYDKLNLGNLHAAKGKARISCTLFLTPEDINDLTLLDQAGVSITARCIPSDCEKPWRKLVPVV